MADPAKYEKLEDDLVALLQGQFFTCKVLPDKEEDYQQGIYKPRVYCSYDTSDYADSKNTSMIVQDDRIRIGFDIECRNRRGENGIFAVYEIIVEKILGLKLQGYDKLQLLAFTPLQPSEPNGWHYYMQFTTRTNLGDKQPQPDDPDAPLLINPEFDLP